jgi:hypothetical protein
MRPEYMRCSGSIYAPARLLWQVAAKTSIFRPEPPGNGLAPLTRSAPTDPVVLGQVAAQKRARQNTPTSRAGGCAEAGSPEHPDFSVRVFCIGDTRA